MKKRKVRRSERERDRRSKIDKYELPRLGIFFLIYFCFVILFVLQKPLFMLGNIPLYKGFGFVDWMEVILHGVSLDLSVAAYFTVIPGLLLLASSVIKSRVVSSILNFYFIIVLAFIAILFIVDTALYKYWGFHLDTTAFFYLRNPKDAMASATLVQIVVAFALMIVYFGVNFLLFRVIAVRKVSKLEIPRNRPLAAILLLLATGLLFIPIRGGFSVSTMNIGNAYYSSNMLLNHAAVNVEFNFIASAAKPTDFSSQYRFMDDREAQRIFEKLEDKVVLDSIPKLFNQDSAKINVVLFVLEGFSAEIIEPLGGLAGITPNLTKLCNEGILFSNFYANSFRTDRGLVAITSGYPGQPTSSIMKYPQKSQTLPSIPKTLKQAGYDMEFYYGGDIDFTNMHSYFISCGIDKIISDKDFSIKERLNKWGAPDHLVFGKLEGNLNLPQSQPFFKMLLTLSSHEPFEVPYHKFEDPYLNSVAYTDSCIGHFMDVLKKTPYWNNTVVIFVPDHAALYPQTLLNYEPRRYHIPLIWAGGALAAPQVISKYASQIDIASTLLSQLGLPHDDFKFSKNILNPSSPEFAFYAFKDGFGFITPNETAVYDNEAGKTLLMQGVNPNTGLTSGKAFLQVLYDDLAKR